ncbi:glycosyltransferase family 1 protein [uncultured Microscilla sp.]|uniref:glycosyltransferase family 4 protein n=1 Tax=uncultured Microscilla sp. TaxID=432653 RepID=UPI00261AB750|nr:glycosyltransferase family 1 protein [uncultured Microscilla sp.]
MKIGFDAKRAFFNHSGLGNYSRNMLQLLAQHYPEHQYHLYTPSNQDTISFELQGAPIIKTPQGWTNRKLKSLWRSLWMAKDLQRDGIDLFHGLSNQLPKNIGKFKGKSVVTIHDLIFLRYPTLYKKADRMIDTRKFRHAAQAANRVIAVSKQTKADLIDFMHIPAEKISVVYQNCHSSFSKLVSKEEKTQLSTTYHLPQNYMLSVGTIEARKNIGIVIEALQKGAIDMPLVVVGSPTPYLDSLKASIAQNPPKAPVIFLHNVPLKHLPGLYQMAQLFVYPSIFEGFGIPILEALHSNTPVVTSQGSCFPESGGNAAQYIDPHNVESVIDVLNKVLNDNALQKQMIALGQQHLQQFMGDKLAQDLMQVYQYVLNN